MPKKKRNPYITFRDMMKERHSKFNPKRRVVAGVSVRPGWEKEDIIQEHRNIMDKARYHGGPPLEKRYTPQSIFSKNVKKKRSPWSGKVSKDQPRNRLSPTIQGGEGMYEPYWAKKPKRRKPLLSKVADVLFGPSRTKPSTGKKRKKK